jgi:hypothetical protein
MARLSSTLELESLHKRQKGRVAKTSSNIAQGFRSTTVKEKPVKIFVVRQIG